MSLFIFILNILVATVSIIIVYTKNITIFCVVIISILLFKIPFVIVNAESNGKNSQIFAYVSPNISFGKYIPLVKHTNWTTILPNPPVPFSLTKLPINIPNDIKKIENSKVDYSKIITYYRRKLVDYGVIRELKNSYKSEGKYTGIINKDDRVVA